MRVVFVWEDMDSGCRDIGRATEEDRRFQKLIFEIWNIHMERTAALLFKISAMERGSVTIYDAKRILGNGSVIQIPEICIFSWVSKCPFLILIQHIVCVLQLLKVCDDRTPKCLCD